MEQILNKVMTTDKSASISMVRMSAMIMIVTCHFFQYYNNELCRWFNVGVQIFFVISGYLYGTKEIGNPVLFFLKSVKKILLPYELFLCIAFLLYFFFFPAELNFVSSLKAFFCADTIHGLGHLWFVGYILFCYFLTPYLFWIRSSIPDETPIIKTLLFYLTLIITFQVIGFAFNCYFMPDRISCYLIGFFAADISYRNRHNKQRIEIIIFNVFCVLTFVFCGIEVFVKYVLYLELSGYPFVLLNAISRYGHLFLGVTLFYMLKWLFRNAKYSDLLVLSDKYSYSIYLVHLLFILSPMSLMSLTTVPYVNWLVVIVLIIISAFLLKLFSDRIECKIFS